MTTGKESQSSVLKSSELVDAIGFTVQVRSCDSKFNSRMRYLFRFLGRSLFVIDLFLYSSHHILLVLVLFDFVFNFILVHSLLLSNFNIIFLGLFIV